MLAFFSDFKGRLKFNGCLIDNTTFRLHYQYTFMFLCIASLLQTARQYFGEPIDCNVDDGVSQTVFNTFCWIHGTFTLPSQLTGRIGRDHPHPGVGPYPSTSSHDRDLVRVTSDGNEIRHAWYQWVVFVLFLQALACYFPHFLWKSWEGGKLKLLLQDLGGQSLDTERETTHTRRHVIVNYIIRNIRTHNVYVYKFIFCEFLNLVNIIVQLYLMDAFFNGHFTTYGSEVLTFTNMEPEERVDPMAKIFPKMSKCTFHKYGPSGTIVNIDGLCVLPLNVINEKIYVFLWFWFLILISWTCIFFCFRIVTIVSSYSRYLVFCGRSKSSRREDVAVIMSKFWFGDWFILMQLCKNMHPEIFHDLVIDLRDRMTGLSNSDFKIYLDYSSFRMDTKLADNFEMKNGHNPYPTLPLIEKPQAPYMETP